VNPKYTIICCILKECGDFSWRVSDCEELVGLLTGDEYVAHLCT